MSHNRYIFLLLFALTLFGCNRKIYFTPSIKKQLITYNQPLEQVQFYVSKKISFKNETLTIDSLGNKNFSTKIIKLKKNTPGICIDSRDSLLFMQFEKGKANNLIFGVSGKSKPNEHYRILAYNWSKYAGVIKYEDLPYKIDIFDAFASLKIQANLLKRLEKKEVQKRTLKGLKVGEFAIDSAINK
jgi:hypothetical protein